MEYLDRSGFHATGTFFYTQIETNKTKQFIIVNNGSLEILDATQENVKKIWPVNPPKDYQNANIFAENAMLPKGMDPNSDPPRVVFRHKKQVPQENILY